MPRLALPLKIAVLMEAAARVHETRRLSEDGGVVSGRVAAENWKASHVSRWLVRDASAVNLMYNFCVSQMKTQVEKFPP